MTNKEKMELAQIIAEAVVGALKATPTPTSTKSRKAKSEAPTTKYSTTLKDYAPKKGADGHYIWGKKTDTVKSKHYLAMQKAYCYAVATKGQAITSDECYKLGIEVDFAEGKAYNKAKTEFKKKYVYVAKEDR